ncbi:alpha/beta fold hydrolase [Streptomyces sp. NPDC021356]|uniref:thioesterase II family protein n=1 Tax=Streptomyces sp. NPDC021356 TaxID=3154900 RepID=UPI0033F90C30
MTSHGSVPRGERSEAGGGLRLYAFPHAGGSALAFQGWAAHVPAGWQVLAMDAPGHGALLGQPLLTDGEALIEHFLGRLGPELQSDGAPFAFFGHSMGALVAYELTRRLLAEGRTAPVWLGVSACGAPSPAEPRLPEPLRDLSDDELHRRMSVLGGTPAKVLDHPGLWRVFAPVIRADLHLVANWRPSPATAPLPVPVSVFGGAEDRAADPGALARWAEHCACFLGVHLFPGGHFYFQDDLRTLTEAVVGEVRTALLARQARAVGR